MRRSLDRRDPQRKVEMTFPERREQYLELADRISALTPSLVAAATQRHQLENAPEQTTRDDVLIGLALKVEGTFRALIDDCRAGRSEALHHLKTMVEGFIYFYVVSADPTPRTAERILADAVAAQKVKRLKDIAAADSEILGWQTFGDEFRQEAKRLATLERLAKDHSVELGGWYASVYRLACESAHLGDLLLWMPEDRVIHLGSRAAEERATTTIRYALQVVLSLIDSINKTNVLGLHAPTEDLWQTLRAIEREGAGTTP